LSNLKIVDCFNKPKYFREKERYFVFTERFADYGELGKKGMFEIAA